MAMSNNDPQPTPTPTPYQQRQVPRNAKQRTVSIFAIPAPLKRIFDQFPLVTYTANELPLRAPRWREDNVLHIFTTTEDAESGRPSFNPSCLKWQVCVQFIRDM